MNNPPTEGATRVIGVEPMPPSWSPAAAVALAVDPAGVRGHPLPVAKPCCSTTSALAKLAEQRAELVAFARRQVGDAALADDLVQLSFARAAERIEQLESADAARAWFFRLLRNAILDDRRRRGARSRATDALGREQPDAIEPVERQTRACQCVSRLAAALKPDYIEALERVEIGESSVKDFAKEKGISAGNAAVRVFRARQALKRSVAEACGACAEGGGCFDCSCAPSADGS